MSEKKSFITFIVIISMLLFFNLTIGVLAQEIEVPETGDQDTFLSVSPDALIVFDKSGSMAWNPAGDDRIYGQSSCAPDPVNCLTGASENCSGGYCEHTRPGCNTDCSRLAIAKRALFSVLDDDNNGVIDAQDANSLGIRIGYMRFRNGDDTSLNYSTGNNRLITAISNLGSDTGTPYSTAYCQNSTSCTSASTCSSNCIAATESATGGTPLTYALREAKLYLDAHKGSDKAKSCRQKFVILMSDGADTYACGGDGQECQANMFARRRAAVAAAKALGDAGYKVFVVGFGAAMPAYLTNTLNWMAYYGRTDNPLAENSGILPPNIQAYQMDQSGCDPFADPPVTTSCCKIPTNEATCFPPGITSCQTSDTKYSATCQSDPNVGNFRAQHNDPGYYNYDYNASETASALSGYAFLAGDADQLTTALKAAFNIIRDTTYSFTTPAIQAVRTIDENYVYEASFQPASADPFWIGHMKRFSINIDGTIKAVADWDAGVILTAQTSRNIWTYAHGALTAFNSGDLTAADLAVSNDALKDAIINYIRTGETNGTVTNWKMGDVFHTAPMSITTPNFFFQDKWDNSKPTAFEEFRLANERSSQNGKRIILVGTNAGVLHAFRTGETSAGGGQEVWSFIPPNLLSRLQTIYHSTHPTGLEHQYFVDGPLSAADVWQGTGTIGSTYKSASDWRTIMVMSEGRGGNNTLWSSHSSCDENFSPNYSTTYAHYCGYYAFDVTNTLSTPEFKWKLGGSAALSETNGKHLGLSWSKMSIGRVRLNNVEKWIGLIGGGYSGTDCKGGGSCDTRGKGFYAVDMKTGEILWSYTHANNGEMDFDLAAGPVAVDYDRDGFIDRAYVGDVGGNVWRFKFCKENNGTGCNTTNWTGSLLFAAPSGTIRPIYTSVAIVTDPHGNLWIYFATGDKTDPTSPNAQERFCAIKDRDKATPYVLSDLESIQNSVYTDSAAADKNGWYISLTGGGEKFLAAPVVFNGVVYITSYIPANANDPCEKGGTAKLFAMYYLSGAGLYDNGARSEVIGTGIPTGAVISKNPHTGNVDIYVSLSEGAGGGGGNTGLTNAPQGPGSGGGNLIYWHDLRMQP